MMTQTEDREDMNASAIMARAAARGEQAETFDTDIVIDTVREMLIARGMHPGLPPGSGRHGMASGAAGMLLRAFGIVPAGDYTGIDRLNAPDPDTR